MPVAFVFEGAAAGWTPVVVGEIGQAIAAVVRMPPLVVQRALAGRTEKARCAMREGGRERMRRRIVLLVHTVPRVLISYERLVPPDSGGFGRRAATGTDVPGIRQGDSDVTLRKDLLALLSAEPRSASSLARDLGLRRGDVEEDLRHALRSARAEGHAVVVLPARCKTCGFTFGEEKLTKPGKCPACRGTRLFEPQVSIRRRSSST